MAFTAKDVANLREKTGCGMMDCKKALTESNGDMDKAIEFLREKGLAAAAKKAGRIAAEGVVATYIANNVGVIIEVNAETDFVAKNAQFNEFVNAAAKTVAEQNPADVDALLKCTISGGKDTVEEALREKILTIGENMKIRRFVRYEGDVVSYIHMGGRIGVLVKFEAAGLTSNEEFVAYGKDVAMQIAAMNPQYVCSHCVPEDVLAEEKKVLLAQIANDPKMASKPDQVKEKMVEGKINKFYKEVCLLDQAFVKDNDMSVSQYTETIGKKLGKEIKILEFTRFEVGEGLEKREDNFADEVASMVK